MKESKFQHKLQNRNKLKNNTKKHFTKRKRENNLTLQRLHDNFN